MAPWIPQALVVAFSAGGVVWTVTTVSADVERLSEAVGSLTVAVAQLQAQQTARESAIEVFYTQTWATLEQRVARLEAQGDRE